MEPSAPGQREGGNSREGRWNWNRKCWDRNRKCWAGTGTAGTGRADLGRADVGQLRYAVSSLPAAILDGHSHTLSLSISGVSRGPV